MTEEEIRQFVSERVMNKGPTKSTMKTDKERHALNRWNERVGPKLVKQELDEWVKLYEKMGKIEFVTDVFGYISREIVFAYKMEKGKTIITTFYGRVSQKPVLEDILALREYNRTYNELVDLKLDKDVLANQKMPSEADDVFLYLKKNRVIYIEKYIAESGRELLFYWERGNGFKEVNLGQPEVDTHDRVILSFLKNNGYASYVSQYQKVRRNADSLGDHKE